MKELSADKPIAGDEKPAKSKKSILVTIKGVFSADTVLGSTINLINSIIGAGILFLPYLLRQLGFLFGSILLIVGACCMAFYLTLLRAGCEGVRRDNISKKGRTEETADDEKFSTFETIAEKGFGKPFFYIVKVMLVIESTCILITYSIILNDIVHATIVNLWGEHDTYTQRWFITLCISTFLMIISMNNKIRKIRWISTISISCVVIFYFTTLFLYVFGFTGEMRAGEFKWMTNFDSFWTIFNSIAISGVPAFAFFTEFVPSIQAEFKLENQRKVGVSVFTTIIFVCVLYVSFGMIGYLSFYENTQDSIILSYTGGSVISNLLRVLIFLEVFLTYPMNNFLIALTVDELVMKVVGALKGKKKEDKPLKEGEVVGEVSVELKPQSYEGEVENPKDDLITQKNKKNCCTKKEFLSFLRMPVMYTLILTMVIYSVAVGYPKAMSILGYIGSVIVPFFGFIFPAAFYLKFTKFNLWKTLIIVDITIVVVFVFGILPTFCSLFNDIMEYTNE